MVAGLSSRFGGKIKQFARVGPQDETLIEYSLNQALPAGFTKIIFIVGNMTEKPFKEIFGNSYKNVPVHYALQSFDAATRDKPWGTGDAVCSATKLINEPFVICTGDDIYGSKTFEILANHLRTENTEITVVKKLIEMLPEKGSVSRGTFEIDKNDYVIGARETHEVNRENLADKKLKEDSPTNLSVFGLHPETLKLLDKKLKEFKEENKDNRKIEFYLNIELAKLAQEGIIKIKLYNTPEKWLGITNPEDEEKVRAELKNN